MIQEFPIHSPQNLEFICEGPNSLITPPEATRERGTDHRARGKTPEGFGAPSENDEG